MFKYSISLTLFVICSALIGCSSGGGDNPSGGNGGDGSGTNFTFNGKSPSEFYAQFYSEVLNCDDNNATKWLRVAAAVDASINTNINLDNGSYISVDLYMTESRFRAVLEISEDSNQFGIQGTTVVASSEVNGSVKLSNGKLLLTANSGALVATIENGIELNGEDTIVFKMHNAIQAEVSSGVSQKMGPALEEKVLMKNIKKSLTSAEGNIGCGQGVESLVFQ